MTEVSEFRQYADEALRWAEQSKTEKERRSLLDLARTWAQAATACEPPPMGVNYCSPTDDQTAR
jgi:hypothetical protein